jgi:cyclase
MHDYIHPHSHPTRRDFLSQLLGSALAGASVLEASFCKAAWARAQAPTAGSQLFNIEKAAEGIYFAASRSQAIVNCNAAIFVQSQDVLVVDSHSKPSAAASLVAQIQKEITSKPVRYVVNSHFHWDHVQGNSAYRSGGGKIDIIASAPTKQLMQQETTKRLKIQLDEDVPKQIEDLKTRRSKSTSSQERAILDEQIRQMEAYRAEMGKFQVELPTITFEKTYVIKDPAHDLHLEFHGQAHTAGDIVVFCPAKRAVATGDMIHGGFPYINDGFPRLWPKTIDSVGQLAFDRILPGHGPLHPNKLRMVNMRNYIEELTQRVAEGKKAGLTVTELQKTITVKSLKSLQADGYGEYISGNYKRDYGLVDPLPGGISDNIAAAYKNLDRT